MKRYRLVIPEKNISLNNLTLAYYLAVHWGVNNTEITENSHWNGDGEAFTFQDIPKEWLHEIEEEKPKRPIDWFFDKYGDDEIRDITYEYFRIAVQGAFSEGESNNELRHRETVRP